MKFFCASCGKPLGTGMKMCGCGQMFDHPVPEEGESIGAQYWPPKQPSSAEDNVRRVRAAWDGVPAAAKTVGFGTLAVVLIAFALIDHHNTATASADTAAMGRSTQIEQTMHQPVLETPPPVIPATPAPVILTRPSPTSVRTSGNYGLGSSGASPGNEVPIQQQINALENQKSSLVQEKMSLLMEEQTAHQQGDETTAGMKALDVNSINAQINTIDVQLGYLR